MERTSEKLTRESQKCLRKSFHRMPNELPDLPARKKANDKTISHMQVKSVNVKRWWSAAITSIGKDAKKNCRWSVVINNERRLQGSFLRILI